MGRRDRRNDVVRHRASPRDRGGRRGLGPAVRGHAETRSKPRTGRRHDLHRSRILSPCRAWSGRARSEARRARLEPRRWPRRVRGRKRHHLGRRANGVRDLRRPLRDRSDQRQHHRPLSLRRAARPHRRAAPRVPARSRGATRPRCGWSNRPAGGPARGARRPQSGGAARRARRQRCARRDRRRLY